MPRSFGITTKNRLSLTRYTTAMNRAAFRNLSSPFCVPLPFLPVWNSSLRTRAGGSYSRQDASQPPRLVGDQPHFRWLFSGPLPGTTAVGAVVPWKSQIEPHAVESLLGHNMKRHFRVLLGIALLLLIAGGVLLGTVDSHHTNFQYLSWKCGFSSYRPSVALRYLNVDVGFREALRGKSRSEIARWFPDLRPPSKADEYRRIFYEFVIRKDFLWIGDSEWGIEFEKGKATDFHHLKW